MRSRVVTHDCPKLYHTFLKIKAVWEYSAAHSDTSARMQLGRKYCRCVHETTGRCTCDFSCL